MRSFERNRALQFAVVLFTITMARHAAAQPLAGGFAVERFYPSAPGAGWFVMDDLAMRGGLGGAMSLTGGYAHDPLRIRDGVRRIAVVSDEAFTDFGFAVTYDRWRVYLNLDAPLFINGESGTVGGYQFAPKSLDFGANPDTLTDARIGVDARAFGTPTGRLRLGTSAQLLVPNGKRCDLDADMVCRHPNYYTDATPRAMGRVLFAGDEGPLTYAGHLGVHVRPLDDAPTPGSPQGSELLFGLAGGAKMPVRTLGTAVLIVGAEMYGATAFRSLFGSTSTALEGLATGRIEGTEDDGPQLRFKLGAGAGINQHFGAPEWRVVFAIELFDHSARLTRQRIKSAGAIQTTAPN
jgi:hypothetical protein